MSVPDHEPPSTDPVSPPQHMLPFDFELPLADALDPDIDRDSVLCRIDDDGIPVVMPLACELVPVVDPREIECWRCGWFDVPDRGRCTRCDSRIPRPRLRRPPRPQAGTGGPSRLAVVLISYGLILFLTIAFAVALAASGGAESKAETLHMLAVLEAVDTVVVLFTLLLVGRVGLRDAPEGSIAVAWSLAGPVLFILICGNLLFSALLRWIFSVPLEPGFGVSIMTVVLICLQPAIVEELFFRHVALGALRREMSLRAAILITSVMFAVAHLGNPFGMPYLFVAGVVFGYARVYGGLALSMIMHFLHNFAVIAIDVSR